MGGKWISRQASRARLLRAYFAANVAVMLEYRMATLTQVFGMFINDILWVVFWVMFFTRFPVIRGWTVKEVIILWAEIALAFGLAAGFCGNVRRIATMIVQGQLDYYLTLPRSVLPHLLISQFRIVNIGDVLFGPALVLVMVDLTWVQFATFLVTSALAGLIMLSFFIITGSLAFYLGNAETLSSQVGSAFIHCATYPTPIFDSYTRIILFTILPAGFVSYFPVELVRAFNWPMFFSMLGGAVFLTGAAFSMFYMGLRRYESGNLMMMRG